MTAKKMLLMLTPGRAALANVSHLYHSQANTHTDTKHTHIATKFAHIMTQNAHIVEF